MAFGSDFRRGDIFLYSGNNIISSLIKKITKSPFSHTGWLDKHKGVLESLDAEEDGVALEEFPYSMDRVAVLRFKLEKAKLKECLEFASKQIGKPYDMRLFFGLLWRWAFGWRRKKDIGDWSNGYIYSELVAMPLLMNAGIILTKDVHPGNSVPGDIWNYAIEHPDTVQIVHIGTKVKKALGLAA